jgi:radical SAM superfamily enzyme YgiQ (UPF0313 family)
MMHGDAEALKILLVYPRYPDTFWSFRHALKFVSKKSFSPPLGLLTVAALLPETWNLKLVDLNVSELKEKDIQWADYVLMSAMDVQQASVREVITRVKARGTEIVAGGPLFTMSPDRFPEIDHLVLKEAEEILPALIEDLTRGEAKPIYAAMEWPDMTSSPIPDWSLIDNRKYASMCIQYSRGCIFDCDFCAVTVLNGKRPRMKTGLQVLEELEALYLKGWRGGIFFTDDNFTVKPEKLKGDLLSPLIRWMERKKYPFFFFTQASLNLADDVELIEMMVRAGFDSVFLGIESPDEKCLEECHKVQNRHRDLMGMVKKIQRSGLQVTGGFILGFDSDPLDIFEKQIDFIQRSGIVTAMVGLLNAERGTKLYDRLQKEKRLIEDTSGDNTNFSVNFVPKLGYRQLIEGYERLVTFIYSPKHFYKRLITFLKIFEPPKRTRGQIELRDIKAFLHSFWSLGVVGEERLYYWKALFWTLLRCPQLLPLCVRLAIYGYHFRKVFQAQISKSENLTEHGNPISMKETKPRDAGFRKRRKHTRDVWSRKNSWAERA